MTFQQLFSPMETYLRELARFRATSLRSVVHTKDKSLSSVLIKPALRLEYIPGYQTQTCELDFSFTL